MKIIKTVIVAAMASTIATASFANEMPTETKGLAPVPLHVLSLQQQIPVMAGYALRSRQVALAPGGSIKKHSHADRPGFLYVLEGELTEYKDGTSTVVRAGDSWIETRDTVHGVRNNSDKPVVVIVIDIIKE